VPPLPPQLHLFRPHPGHFKELAVTLDRLDGSECAVEHDGVQKDAQDLSNLAEAATRRVQFQAAAGRRGVAGVCGARRSGTR
jgi:hypothetical protein